MAHAQTHAAQTHSQHPSRAGRRKVVRQPGNCATHRVTAERRSRGGALGARGLSRRTLDKRCSKERFGEGCFPVNEKGKAGDKNRMLPGPSRRRGCQASARRVRLSNNLSANPIKRLLAAKLSFRKDETQERKVQHYSLNQQGPRQADAGLRYRHRDTARKRRAVPSKDPPRLTGRTGPRSIVVEPSRAD